LDKFGLVQTENKIDYQASGFNAEANEDDPGNNVYYLEYEVVCF
jgi:hypothetical protein